MICTRAAIIAGLVILGGVVAGQARSGERANQTPTPFFLRRVALELRDPSRSSSDAGPRGSTLAWANKTLTLEGTDRSGDPWEAFISAIPDCSIDFGVASYNADLDRDGTIDSLTVVPTCGNGNAPSAHAIAILFDRTGRPVPFEAEGEFDALPNAVARVVDADHDGRADLLTSASRDEPRTTVRYAAEQGHWRRVGDVPATVITDLSNDRARIAGVLTAWHWPARAGQPRQISDFDLVLTMRDTSGRQVPCTPEYWEQSARLVLDTLHRRRIVSLASPADADELLGEVVMRKLPVRLFGQRYADRCSPELVWASDGRR
jgi:hypothetical protein